MQIGHLHVQVDNCVGEDKNKYVLGYLAMLVSLRVAETVELHFMIVGHTHIKIAGEQAAGEGGEEGE